QASACGLTPLITGFEALEKAAALSSPADPWGVAIKLDTGMSRLGFSAEDIPALLERLRACPGLKPTLAVSHFPCADMPEKENFTRRQLEKFTAMTDSLRVAYPALKRSLANSAGTMGWPESRFELCRPGFSLYGGNPFQGTAWEERGAGLEPVMEVSAPLLQVRHLKPGEGISYGQTFIAPREMSVAVVGAGYATGYPRSASGRIHVLVNGRRAPQVGRICMGMFMIDVTGLSARAGDLAWLLGGPAAPGETPVNIDELAEACGGFSYELLCLLGQGSPRVYHK
uniref:alanine racemase n=1 Tax=Desulfovibrio sp. TaxID=885 RepID=UPI003077C827